MIKLTEVSGKFTMSISIPTDVVIRDNGNGTATVKVQNMPGYITVQESSEEVVRKIMEYKLAMSAFDSAHAASLLPHERKGLYEYAEEELNRLAGLEQTP
jgi:uncharacterized protein YlzI (FlbEa/FlbD family)